MIAAGVNGGAGPGLVGGLLQAPVALGVVPVFLFGLLSEKLLYTNT